MTDCPILSGAHLIISIMSAEVYDSIQGLSPQHAKETSVPAIDCVDGVYESMYQLSGEFVFSVLWGDVFDIKRSHCFTCTVVSFIFKSLNQAIERGRGRGVVGE